MDANEKPNVICNVCGENDYEIKEGYYYCKECGTKSEQLRALVIEIEDEFDENKKHRNTMKVKTKIDKPELTSWECYNYILRGLVDELIEMGAKDELKPVVLQIWAAYLRRSEVAFFNRRHAELPKLGLYFEPRDATILYNHAKERRKIKRGEKKTPSVASSRKEMRKGMKQFEQSQYEESLSQSYLSQSQSSFSFARTSSLGDSSWNSSTSAPTQRAIRLRFSSKARKHLKKKMPIQHLKKHEEDFDQSLQCHKIRGKKNDLKSNDVTMELNMKQLYAIIAIALNLIEDDIQLVDLMRFVAEGHVSSKNLVQFFPENISETCKATLASLRFHIKSMYFSVTSIHDHIGKLCKILHIRSRKMPNIHKLVERYITELYLPVEMYTLIERLINIHPPEMKWDYHDYIPRYEIRAMAYILFTLKLLFGLDGRKEKRISRSAIEVNAKLAALQLEDYEELFVWDDWVEYIEMRKVILCSHYLPMCNQFKEMPSRALYLQNLNERSKFMDRVISKEQKKNNQNMEIVFEHFLQVDSVKDKPLTDVKLGPSFTPCHTYFKRIQQNPTIDTNIPDFMQVDHTKRSLLPLIKPTKLKEIFAQHATKLNVIRLGCTNKRTIAGTFKSQGQSKINNDNKVKFSNNKAAWKKKVNDVKPAETIFNPKMHIYSRRTLKRMEVRNKLVTVAPMETSQSEPIDLHKSIEVFDEDNMEPAEATLSAPRRHLERIDLFAEVSDDEDENNQHINDDFEVTTLKISNMDYWLLMGRATDLSEIEEKEVKSKLPLTFFWLLEICANTLGVKWKHLYDQLQVIETFFAYSIEPLSEFKDRIVFKGENEIKEINQNLRHFKQMW